MRRLRMTHTVATMEVSPGTYAEIRRKFLEAGYDHVVMQEPDGSETLDMTGIGLVQDEALPTHLGKRDTYQGPG